MKLICQSASICGWAFECMHATEHDSNAYCRICVDLTYMDVNKIPKCLNKEELKPWQPKP